MGVLLGVGSGVLEAEREAADSAFDANAAGFGFGLVFGVDSSTAFAFCNHISTCTALSLCSSLT